MSGNEPSKGIVVRSEVAPAKHYSAYREVLRHDFWYACAYCSMAETESQSIAFQIDHYEPVTAEPELEHIFHNLMWACQPCNELKSDNTPPAEARKLGFRFLRPDQDDPRDHLEPLPAAPERLRARTPTGEWTLEMLQLNRRTLREIRRLRVRYDAARSTAIAGLKALDGVSLDDLPGYIRMKFDTLRKRLGDQQTAIDLRILNRSEQLDPDPAQKEMTRARRDYLRRIKVISPEPWTGRAARRKKQR